MRKIFLLALLMCMLLLTAVAEAAQITDVKWGVDKNNVLRLVVDITDAAGYDVKLEGAKLKLTVNAKAAGQIPKMKKIKSMLADELRVVDGGSYTEVHLPLNQQINAGDYKAFVLKQDAKTGRPFRVVLDVWAAKTAATNNSAAAASTGAAASKPVVSSKPVVGSRHVKSAASENYQPISKPVNEVKTPVVSTQRPTSNTQVATAQKPAAEVKAPVASVQKPAATKASGPKVIVIPKNNGDNNKATGQKGGKVTTKSDKEELPLAIKAKSKFRTGGGIKDKIITLDPGHGGSDPGAIGASGLKEKQITLEISMRVKELLEKEGAKVFMTRTTDKDVYAPNASDRAELQARVNVAEKHNSDLFLSLHINSSVNKSVGGFSSYYYPKTDNDLKIAKTIQDKFAKNFGVDNLGVRQANFYVVKRCSMPATLLEMCFISNPKEEKLMKSKWFQKKTARLIVEGVKNYFD
ncbi:N-acetylmuramoyl-L-alanine amidase [Phascolarctobacterium sp.]|uniref:N-acetylmuramoyl-L-alanine amidase family protein n=1 Tax=Phascolarctobacterium sp. TaxID=2049039 RepID=UPI002A827561|nr:N-acetylmuramoyl-L-alanine amidase [Phascolarctobacterium sp.]MDY5045407.1 N-acetylmuramoyl-L-alanine amidase [Phascolarctobacterium sp.]